MLPLIAYPFNRCVGEKYKVYFRRICPNEGIIHSIATILLFCLRGYQRWACWVLSKANRSGSDRHLERNAQLRFDFYQRFFLYMCWAKGGAHRISDRCSGQGDKLNVDIVVYPRRGNLRLYSTHGIPNEALQMSTLPEFPTVRPRNGCQYEQINPVGVANGVVVVFRTTHLHVLIWRVVEKRNGKGLKYCCYLLVC